MNKIILKNVGKVYGEQAVLGDISLVLDAGKILAVVGKNGSGKSTVLKIVAGLLEPTSGEVRFLFDGELKKSCRGRLAYVSPEFALYERMTVMENLELLSGLSGVKCDRIQAAAALKMFGLAEDVLDKLAGSLSTGMAQRVKLAMMILSDADIWLLDEPSSNLDAAGVACLLQEIKKAKEASKLIMIATNDSREVAVADEVLELQQY